ncbi:MAG: hypothetical protein RJA66_989 [Actinomycetota bacterium]|jgi:hypothetical protein
MASNAKRPIGLTVVLAIIGLEQLVVLYLLSSYVLATLAGQVKSLPTMLALAALGLIVAIWLAYVVKALYDGRRWARSGAIFWQLVQLAIAWGSFTGQFANAAIGIGLIVPSVAVIALLFTKPVFNATQGEIPAD